MSAKRGSGLLARTEVLAGLSVALLGVLCGLAIGDLEMGSASEMGPGYVPRALAAFLVLAGIAMTAVALLRSASRPGERTVIDAIQWRPVLVVSLSMFLFGALVDRQGIVIATLVSTAVATGASRISRMLETPLLCAALALLAAFAFVKGLGLAIPIWPR